MDDRQLLEAAAKAAGYAFKWGTDWHDKGTPLVDGRNWYPLDDDGDALRLAVKLNITVFIYDDETSTALNGVVAKNWGSKEANTRRAIVMAAASLQESRDV